MSPTLAGVVLLVLMLTQRGKFSLRYAYYLRHNNYSVYKI